MTITDTEFVTRIHEITGRDRAELEEIQRRASTVTSYRYSQVELLLQVLSSSLSPVSKRQAIHSALGMLPEPARSVHRDALLAGADHLDERWGQPAVDEPLMTALAAAIDAVEAALRDAFGGAA